MPVSEEEHNKLKKELDQLKQELKSQKDKEENVNKQTQFTDYSTTDKDDTDAESGSTDQKQKRKRRKKKDLKTLLTSHQRIIKSLASAVLTDNQADEKIKSELNGLSKNGIRKAIDHNNFPNYDNPQNMPSPPKLRETGEADIKTLHDAIGSLKDLYKNTFSGGENEDLPGLLKHASQIAFNSKLSIEQFYSLLKSRIAMGTPLYSEIKFHYDQLNPPRILFKDILPIYAGSKSYLQALRKMNSYRPNHNDSVHTVISKVKELAYNMADTVQSENKTDFIHHRVRDKLLTLYSNIAPDIMERENQVQPQSVGAFLQMFLSFAPRIENFNKKYPKYDVHEISEISVNEITTRPTKIKLTKADAERLKDKCYKCSNLHPTQGPHFGRDCEWYKDTPLAYYICNKCRSGVHLPKFCKQNNEAINNIEIEIIDSDETSDMEKN